MQLKESQSKVMSGTVKEKELTKQLKEKEDQISQMEQKPCVRIVEQPKSNSLRFRYQCEGRGAGALQVKNLI